ncbi:MAG: ATP-dependent DNA ligase [bacterium]|nr:ATP-dependent DNA ligase [bacterium]
MHFEALIETAAGVAATRSRKAKLAALVPLLRAAAAESPVMLAIAVASLAGEIRQGALGIGPAAMRALKRPEPCLGESADLELGEVDAAFERIRVASGKGSRQRKLDEVTGLLARATAAGQDFLVRLLVGELRQGAVEGLMREAIAQAFDVRSALVQRAAMLSGRLALVAERAHAGGAAALAEFRLEVGRPLEPMLAQTAESPAMVIEKFGGPAAFDFKLDGARIQVHKNGDDVRVFTRQLRDVTVAVPEVVELLRAVAAPTLVLDGEVLALRVDGRPQPFQVTMRRFGRQHDIAALRSELPLTPVFFDCLHHDGEDVFDRPLVERRAALVDAVGGDHVVPQLVTADVDAAEAFYGDALAAGHEGLVAKADAATYEAGRRGAQWLKLKPAHTLDLVVLAVEAGSGRRSGLLSNLWLGARNDEADDDPDAEPFVMLGKTFKGLTDEVLRWQTAALGALEVKREGHVVHVRPELVVEIAFDGLQRSSQYSGGLALRFARVRGYREDKTAAEADTMSAVRALMAE